MTRSGIPTDYRSQRFRSRLEARWAAFFDLVGWRWTYEPFDTDGYIPDFLIHGDWPFLVEVGPCVTETDYRNKTAKPNAAVGSLKRDVVILGVDPICNLRSPVGNDASRLVATWWTPQAGLHGEYGEWGGEERDWAPESGFSWEPGVWGRCFDCGAVGIVHELMSYSLRPCSHHQSGSFGDRIAEAELEDLWRTAGNRVQWKSGSQAWQ